MVHLLFHYHVLIFAARKPAFMVRYGDYSHSVVKILPQHSKCHTVSCCPNRFDYRLEYCMYITMNVTVSSLISTPPLMSGPLPLKMNLFISPHRQKPHLYYINSNSYIDCIYTSNISVYVHV